MRETASPPRPEGIPSWRAMTIGPLAPATWTLSLGVGLHATGWYMIAAAMPTAVLDLGGAALLSWTLTAFLVASIVGAASAGRLKAAHGGRRVLLGSTLVVVAGALLGAAAPGMELVVASRAVQGFGEGVILAMSYVLGRELFSNAAWPRLFAALAVAWAFAALAGPIAGGGLTDLVGWRAAFWGQLPLIALFAVLVVIVLPADRPTPAAAATRPPLGRLLFLGAGAMAVCLAGTAPGRLEAAALLAASALSFVQVFRLDARAAARVFPQPFLRLGHRVGVGLWIVVTLFLAEAAVAVYVPFLVQTGHGTSPTFVGYFVAIVALTWSAAAILVSGLTGRAADAALVAGPVCNAVGLAMVAWTLHLPSLVPLGIALAVIGTGFGLCYTTLSQRILAAARAGEEDITSGAVPTLESLGAAVGAALAGLVGNALGFAESVGGPGALAAGQATIALSAIVGLLPVAGAVMLVRLDRRAVPSRA